MIDAAVISSIMELNELTDAIDVLANKLDSKIDEEYAQVIRYQKVLEHEKGQLLKAFEIIYEAYRTNEPDLKKLTESGVVWIPEIIPEGRPTKKDLRAIGEHLYARSDSIHVVQTELQPFWDEYRAAHKEIDDLADQAMERIAKVRLILLVWTRAHQKMASGTVDPADWFDIKDVPALLWTVGKKNDIVSRNCNDRIKIGIDVNCRPGKRKKVLDHVSSRKHHDRVCRHPRFCDQRFPGNHAGWSVQPDLFRHRPVHREGGVAGRRRG